MRGVAVGAGLVMRPIGGHFDSATLLAESRWSYSMGVATARETRRDHLALLCG